MLKTSIIVLVALLAIGFGLTKMVKSDKKFEVEHKAAEPPTVYPDGSYTAGQEEHYIVWASRAVVYKYTGELSKFFKVAAVIILGLIVLYIGFCSVGQLVYKHGWLFALAGLCAACWFGAFASAYAAGNKKKLTPAEYEQVKDNLESLFTKEKLIR